MAEEEVKDDLSADDWAAAMAEQGVAEPASETASAETPAPAAAIQDSAPVFKALSASPTGDTPGNLEMVMDIPVQMTVELGRTKIQIRNLLQLTQGSVVELDRMAGEPMDVLVNGCLVAQGEVVVVNDKFGIRLTDVIAPEERLRRLNR
jgi:flagellar motor switch protein FliN